MQVEQWALWSEKRPEDPKKLYLWRVAPCVIGGLKLTPEWADTLHLCGMGYGDNEYWPDCSHWDGYRRTVPSSLEWREAPAGIDKKWFQFRGLDLPPCKYCGTEMRIEWSGPWIAAPIWKASKFSIWCGGCGLVNASYFTDLKRVCEALNRTAEPVRVRVEVVNG